MSKEIIIKTKRTTNYVYLNSKGSATPMVFLHGFTGSHHSWNEVVERLDCAVITPDLPGHGKSTFNSLSADYCIDDWCEDFNQILDFLDISKIDLCGYSMGGRLAIVFASKYPKKINKLILESASYGIKSKEGRKERLSEDLTLCNLIETDFPKFIQKWENSPLFSKQRDRNPQGFLNQQKERFLHNPKQLSKALKSFSQGNIGFCKENFAEFQFPITVINGFEDFKYVEIGKRFCNINQTANQDVLDNSGHNVHLENPSEYIDCLK